MCYPIRKYKAKTIVLKRLCLKKWDPSQIVEKHFKSLEILKVSVKESSHCQSLTKKSV